MIYALAILSSIFGILGDVAAKHARTWPDAAPIAGVCWALYAWLWWPVLQRPGSLSRVFVLGTATCLLCAFAADRVTGERVRAATVAGAVLVLAGVALSELSGE